MALPAGEIRELTIGQRYLGDLAHLAAQMPLAAVRRRFDVSTVAAARAAAGPRPSWLAVFTKALACVAGARPELRQVYRSWPRPGLYEHRAIVAAVAVERRLDEELPMLWARLRDPQRLGLLDLADALHRYREDPAERLGQARHVCSRSRRNGLVRRLAWWRDAAWSGRRRARRLGTLAVASVGQHGAELVDPKYPATAVLTYGTIKGEGEGEGEGEGAVDVCLHFDARVLSASAAAGILQELERVLHCEILMELRYFQLLDAA